MCRHLCEGEIILFWKDESHVLYFLQMLDLSSGESDILHLFQEPFDSSYTQRTSFLSSEHWSNLLVNEGRLVFLYAGAKIIGRFWNVIGTIACWRSTSKAVVSLTNEMNAKCLERNIPIEIGNDFLYWTNVFSLAMIFTSCTGPNVWKQVSISAPVV